MHDITPLATVRTANPCFTSFATSPEALFQPPQKGRAALTDGGRICGRYQPEFSCRFPPVPAKTACFAIVPVGFSNSPTFNLKGY